MAVHAAQQHGVVRNRGGERVVSREVLIGPEVLIPPAAQHPGARRKFGGGLPHPRHDLVETGRVAEIHLFEGRAVPDEMAVALGHAREHVRAGEVHDLGGQAPPRRGVGGRHESHETAVGNRDLQALRSARQVHDAAGQQAVTARGVGTGRARQRDQRHEHHEPQHPATQPRAAAGATGSGYPWRSCRGGFPVPERPITRRDLIATTAKAAAVAAAVGPALAQAAASPAPARPAAVSSMNGLEAVKVAVERMAAGASPVDAAVAGVALPEADPDDVTVGYGGRPTRRASSSSTPP